MIARPGSSVPLLFAVLLAGCGISEVRHLDTMKNHKAQGDATAILQERSACDRVDEVCAQSREISGETCLKAALGFPPLDAKARPMLDCAVEDYEVAARGPDAAARPRRLANLGRALQAHRDRGGTTPVEDNTRLLQVGMDLRGSPGPEGRLGAYYAASAQFDRVVSGTLPGDAERCAALREATASLRGPPPTDAESHAAWESLSRQVVQRSQACL
jgi:hypothetical protein